MGFSQCYSSAAAFDSAKNPTGAAFTVYKKIRPGEPGLIEKGRGTHHPNEGRRCCAACISPGTGRRCPAYRYRWYANHARIPAKKNRQSAMESNAGVHPPGVAA
ncbi:MAG: hypothetical protein AVDCRST_MAG89-1736 [uncultured Gemmatimonadetes bacterium]|uniref:Uncharacterized protein n=1 Tax=uncultured Gemmatimonadota bacterium TaxID=203437 RepID=A0A6J4L3I9_9BACT|nr:MAG: hypothetical protein AVDCRST_MAG89-1736 [uncultured Gemmatimonadota bacterium]